MGIIKGSLKLVGNVVTLGGMSRLEDAQTAYQASYVTYQSVLDEANLIKEEIESHINAIGVTLQRAKKSLDKGEAILNGSLKAKTQWVVDIKSATFTLSEVAKFQSDYYGAFSSIGTGAVTGGTMAIGSWALVSAFGAASTGTAIAELSGVAATNATLAWFGGGSLAAGGAGMSGGTFVLGGLVAIPFIIIAAKGTHKKANEVEKETVKIEQETVTVSDLRDAMTQALPTVLSKKLEADETCKVFVEDITRLRKIIRPWHFLSLLKQKIYGWLGLSPYSEPQKAAIHDLNSTISLFLAWFRGSDAALNSPTSDSLLTNRLGGNP